MHVIDSIGQIERNIRFLSARIDVLVKLTEVTLIHLIDKDPYFEKVLEKGCHEILKDGT